jgi:hypothetical protein
MEMKTVRFVDYINDKDSIYRSGGIWIKESSGLKIYVRRAIRVKGGYDLADIFLPKNKQRKGILTRFLQEYKNYPLRIENVLNPYLEQWLFRQTEWKIENPKSFVNTVWIQIQEEEKMHAKIRFDIEHAKIRFDIGNDNCIYAIFNDTDQAWKYHEENNGLFIACFDNYENAVCVQELWGM